MNERIAAIDVGTNTVLLTIAEVGENSKLEPIVELSRLPRLGQGVDQARQLDPVAVARTLEVLREYKEVCRASFVSRLGVTGTSALRDAGRADEFLSAAERIVGVPIEVASGRREAELTYRGATYGLMLDSSCPQFVFDVGGGSTEFVLGRGDSEVLEALSVDLGSVRLFERHGRVDLPSEDALARLTLDLRVELSQIPELFFRSADSIVGVAGTVASLFSIAHRHGGAEPNLAHGGELSLAELRGVCSRLVRMSLAERERIPCLGSGRADVILYGAGIVLALLGRWADERGETDPKLIVSERGVRYGRLRELSGG